MLHILKVIGICLEVLLVFNLMIIVHELGHFLAARWRGLVIEEFGLWFGKPLWKKTINGVVYSWGSLPFGGFVKLPQLAPMEMMEGKTELTREQLPPISVLDKIIVAFAGPLFSFLLAAVFAVIVWQVGRPVSEGEASTTIGMVGNGSPAEQAGLQVGDKILEVDGHKVSRFGGMGSDSITWRIVRSEGATIPIKLERAGQVLDVEVTPKIPPTQWWQRRGLRQIQVGPAETPMVAKVLPDSPAEKAGLKPNDLVTEVNGKRIYSEFNIIEAAAENPGQQLTLSVKRGEEILKVPFLPNGAKIAAVAKDSPAEVAGLKAADRVVGIDGTPQRISIGISEYVQKNQGKPLELAIEREKFPQKIKVTPVPPVGQETPRLGIEWAPDDSVVWDQMGQFQVIHPKPVEQLHKSVMMIVDTLGAVFSQKSSIGVQHMGGPVMMMRAYYMMFESPEGWRLALWFSVVLNVNLALLNLLPIPVLDGGHITLAIVEGVRRRPVNVRILEYLQTACALLIIGFMVFIMFFDVQDWIGGEKGPQMKFDRAAVAEAQKG
jgi:regulator of sigma E protease